MEGGISKKNIALGTVFLCLSGTALESYLLTIGDFDVRYAIFLALFMIFSRLAVGNLFFGQEKARYLTALYAVFFVLTLELFFRSTLYGRFDFFEYTIFEADAERREYFISEKVNFMLFRTIKMFFSFSVFSGVFIINVLGNIFILTPCPIFLVLAYPHERKMPIIGVAVTVLASLLAEVFQFYFMCGSPDIDDLILNSLGGAIGGGVGYLISNRIRKSGEVI